MGVLDADGFLTITDRVKDVIIRGGENISAAEIEDGDRRAARRSPRSRSSPRPTRASASTRARSCGSRRAPTSIELDDITAAARTRSAWPARSGPRSCGSSTTSRAPPSGKVRKVDLRRQLRAEPADARLGCAMTTDDRYRTIEVLPIAGALGAEISGVDLATDLADETVARDPPRRGSSTSSCSSATRSSSPTSSSRSRAASASRSSTRS